MTPQKVTQVLALAGLVWLITSPAFAQVAGSVDTDTMVHNLEAWGIRAAGGIIACIAAYRGVHASSNGHHIGPAVGGLASGVGIAIGGPYLIQHITGFMPY